MKHFLLIFGVLTLSFPKTTTAQLRYLNLNISMNGGYSMLDHNTDFQTTPMYNLYKYTTEFAPGLTWEDYKEISKLDDSFGQPRLGFKGQLTYRDWPVIIEGEAISSSSDYTKAAYAVTAGLGKYFYLADSSIYFSFLGGYKYMVRDYGFGAKTLVNSIGNDFARNEASKFFGPEGAVGRPSGDLFAIHVSFAKTLDWYYRWSVGIEGYYEVDLTDKLVRSTRMTNYGANIFLRYRIFGNNFEPSRYYPNPGGGRRNRY
jgi:hypothetical protein